jgi:thioredoxin 1
MEPTMQQTTTSASGVQVVTDADFQAEVLDAGELVLVDFGAPWCGPCRMMGPTVEQLAGEYAGRVKVATLDVDENQETAARYNVRSLPTFLLFKGGQPVDQVIGAVPRPMLERKIQEHL